MPISRIFLIIIVKTLKIKIKYVERIPAGVQVATGIFLMILQEQKCLLFLLVFFVTEYLENN